MTGKLAHNHICNIPKGFLERRVQLPHNLIKRFIFKEGQAPRSSAVVGHE